MKDLGQIIDAVKANQPANDEDLRFAILALAALNTFDSMALMRIYERGIEKHDFRFTMPWTESFRRTKQALATPPKQWVGWNNDPSNPHYQARRVAAEKILTRFLAIPEPERKDDEQVAMCKCAHPITAHIYGSEACRFNPPVSDCECQKFQPEGQPSTRKEQA